VREANQEEQPAARNAVPPVERLSYRVPEAAAAAGLGVSTVFALIARGDLKSIKRAGRRLILKSDLESFLRGDDADAA
jgi:excisionase family DNA binding protein